MTSVTSDHPTQPELKVNVPLSYKIPRMQMKTGHLEGFQPETLLYIFYSLPHDILQAYAAQELYRKGWRYQKDLRLWFRQGSSASSGNGSSSATAADGSADDASSQPTYFDVTTWETRPYLGDPKELVVGFLSEKECTVMLEGQVAAPSAQGTAHDASSAAAQSAHGRTPSSS